MKPPLHFKKRMLLNTTATTASQSSSPGVVAAQQAPAVIGRSLTPRPRPVTVYQDDATATATSTPPSPPPAKVGIVISHGRAMTLQDKLQMTNSARRSPTSAVSPLQVVNRQQSTPLAAHCKTARRQKPVVKRSLLPPPHKVRFLSTLP